MFKLGLLVLVALGCLSLAQSSKKNDEATCLYESTDGLIYEHLLEISKFKHVKDQFGLIWEVNACARSVHSDAVKSVEYLSNDRVSLFVDKVEDDDDDSDSDDDDEKTMRKTIRGLSSKAHWFDSPLGSNKGAEVVFGSLTQCNLTSNATYKTSIQFICTDNMKPSYSFFFDDCLTVITVNSSRACPTVQGTEGGYQDGSSIESDSEQIEIHSVLTLDIVFGAVAFAAFVFTCCCVACHRIRRRMRAAAAKKQFSNIAFQPIPSSQAPNRMVQIQQVPLYNPYIPTSQIYYYQPTQATMFASEVAVNVQSDERVARALQAKFDNE